MKITPLRDRAWFFYKTTTWFWDRTRVKHDPAKDCFTIYVFDQSTGTRSNKVYTGYIEELPRFIRNWISINDLKRAVANKGKATWGVIKCSGWEEHMSALRMLLTNYPSNQEDILWKEVKELYLEEFHKEYRDEQNTRRESKSSCP